MRIVYLFIIGFVAYVVQALTAYSSSIKGSAMQYYGIALATGMITILAWMSIARHSKAQSLLRYALIWDVMIVLVYLSVPLILGKAHLSRTNAIGVSLLLIGLILTKLGE